MKPLALCMSVDHHGRVLLIRSKPLPSRWMLPGGEVGLDDESPVFIALESARQIVEPQIELIELGVTKRSMYQEQPVYTVWCYARGTTPSPHHSLYEVKLFEEAELSRLRNLSPASRAVIKAQLAAAIDKINMLHQHNRDEARVRESNQRLQSMAMRLLDTESKALLTLAFPCECSNLQCSDSIRITTSEYNALHNHERCFIVIPGHEHLDIERILEACTDDAEKPFYVVEKIFTPGSGRKRPPHTSAS